MCTGNKRMERERGVALIFTLAMLGLLMMLLLAFVGSMSVKKTVSSNAANKRQLDLLVNSAVSRLRLHLEDSEKAGKNLDETVSSTDDSDTLSDGSSPGTAASSAKSSFSKIEFECPEGDETLYDTNLVSGQEDEIEWIYVKDPVSDSYFGRVAYAVIPNVHPILDLKSLGTEIRVGDQYNELNLSDFSNGFKSAGTVSVDKSNILNRDAYAVFYKDNSFDAEHSNFLNIFTTANGLNSEDTYLYRNPKTAGGQYRDSVWRRFDLGNDVLVDYNGNAFKDMSSEDRVDALLGSSGTTISVDSNQMRYFDNNDKINNPDYRNAYVLPFFKKFDNSTTDEVGSSEYKGTFESADQLRNQVAANLIDYILDEDQTVTSDVTPESENITENGIIGTPPAEQGSWRLDISDTTPSTNKKWPEYTGNKRTLYLNEAGFAAWIELDPRTDSLSCKVYTMPMVELIDIYGLGSKSGNNITEIADDYWMGVAGNFSFDITVQVGNNSYTRTIDITLPNKYVKPSEYIESSGLEGMYFIPRWSTSELTGSDFVHTENINYVSGDAQYAYIDLDNVKVDITAAKLLKDTAGDFVPVDFAKIEKNINTDVDPYSITLSLGGGVHDVTLYASAYTNDPRQNLNNEDWDNDAPAFIEGTPVPTSGYTDINSFKSSSNDATSFGKVNPHDYDDVMDEKKDREDNIREAVGDKTGAWEIAASFESQPEDRPISTAYIREAPIRSLWELGFISRGIKWQTINLKTVQADSESDVTSFDPSYEKGDAEILDMVCLNYKNSPKFDINAKSTSEAVSANVKKIWKGLLAPTSSNQTLKIGNPGGDTSADEDNKDVLNYGDNEFTLAADYNAEDVFKLIPNDADVEVNDSDYYFFDTDRKSFLRRSSIAPALYKLAMDEESDIDTDAKQEALIGKVIGLTDAYIYPPEVRVIVVAELLSQQNATTAIDSVRKLVIMKRTPDGRYILSEILPL